MAGMESFAGRRRANREEAEVLEMWLETIDIGVPRLPASSPWRDVALRVRAAMLDDLGRPPLRFAGASARDLDEPVQLRTRQ